jgi:WNK lysine deficient protein kinase
VLSLIQHCLAPEHERYSAQEAIEDPFLGVEPEVVVLTSNEAKNHLTLQVVFKGMDKLSVKFEFNADTDTAEEVVNEMVQFTLAHNCSELRSFRFFPWLN